MEDHLSSHHQNQPLSVPPPQVEKLQIGMEKATLYVQTGQLKFRGETYTIQYGGTNLEGAQHREKILEIVRSAFEQIGGNIKTIEHTKIDSKTISYQSKEKGTATEDTNQTIKDIFEEIHPSSPQDIHPEKQLEHLSSHPPLKEMEPSMVLEKIKEPKETKSTETRKIILTKVLPPLPNEISKSPLQNESQKIEQIAAKKTLMIPKLNLGNLPPKGEKIENPSTQKIEEVIQPIIKEVQTPPKAPPKPSPLKTPTMALSPKAILNSKIDVIITKDKEGKEIKTASFSNEAAMIGFLLKGKDESLKDLDVPLTRKMVLSEFRAYFTPQQLIMGYVSASFEKKIDPNRILMDTIALAKEAKITPEELKGAFKLLKPGSRDLIINSHFSSPEEAQSWVNRVGPMFARLPIIETPKLKENTSLEKLNTGENFLNNNVDKIAHDIFTINANYLLEIDDTKKLSPEIKKVSEGEYDPNNLKAKEWTECFNAMNNILQQNILNQTTVKGRAQAITDTITLGKTLLAMGDFAGAMMILGTLTSIPVGRLKHTWKLVNESSMDDYKKFSSVLTYANNYSNLRKKYGDATSFIPYLATFGKDHEFTSNIPRKKEDHSINENRIQVFYNSRNDFRGFKKRLTEKLSKDPSSFSKKTDFENLLDQKVTKSSLDEMSKYAEPKKFKDNLKGLKKREGVLNQIIKIKDPKTHLTSLTEMSSNMELLTKQNIELNKKISKKEIKDFKENIKKIESEKDKRTKTALNLEHGIVISNVDYEKINITLVNDQLNVSKEIKKSEETYQENLNDLSSVLTYIEKNTKGKDNEEAHSLNDVVKLLILSSEQIIKDLNDTTNLGDVLKAFDPNKIQSAYKNLNNYSKSLLAKPKTKLPSFIEKHKKLIQSYLEEKGLASKETKNIEKEITQLKEKIDKEEEKLYLKLSNELTELEYKLKDPNEKNEQENIQESIVKTKEKIEQFPMSTKLHELSLELIKLPNKNPNEFLESLASNPTQRITRYPILLDAFYEKSMKQQNLQEHQKTLENHLNFVKLFTSITNSLNT